MVRWLFNRRGERAKKSEGRGLYPLPMVLTNGEVSNSKWFEGLALCSWCFLLVSLVVTHFKREDDVADGIGSEVEC